MEREEAYDTKAFNAWWDNEGSQGPTKQEMHLYDQEEWVKKKSKEAWLNGAFKAREELELKAYKKYQEEEQVWS